MTTYVVSSINSPTRNRESRGKFAAPDSVTWKIGSPLSFVSGPLVTADMGHGGRRVVNTNYRICSKAASTIKWPEILSIKQI